MNVNIELKNFSEIRYALSHTFETASPFIFQAITALPDLFRHIFSLNQAHKFNSKENILDSRLFILFTPINAAYSAFALIEKANKIGMIFAGRVLSVTRQVP